MRSWCSEAVKTVNICRIRAGCARSSALIMLRNGWTAGVACLRRVGMARRGFYLTPLWGGARAQPQSSSRQTAALPGDAYQGCSAEKIWPSTVAVALAASSAIGLRAEGPAECSGSTDGGGASTTAQISRGTRSSAETAIGRDWVNSHVDMHSVRGASPVATTENIPERRSKRVGAFVFCCMLLRVTDLRHNLLEQRATRRGLRSYGFTTHVNLLQTSVTAPEHNFESFQMNMGYSKNKQRFRSRGRKLLASLKNVHDRNRDNNTG
jgi:hypothetical protein